MNYDKSSDENNLLKENGKKTIKMILKHDSQFGKEVKSSCRREKRRRGS